MKAFLAQAEFNNRSRRGNEADFCPHASSASLPRRLRAFLRPLKSSWLLGGLVLAIALGGAGGPSLAAPGAWPAGGPGGRNTVCGLPPRLPPGRLPPGALVLFIH